jgi:DNA-binding NarL/FixJ family response regulator
MISARPSLTDDDQSASSVRILVVDDYAPFRRFICSTVEKVSHWHLVGEASDGLEAVQKAEELQPDLVVLDIGLPGLNGIEAGRRIRKLCSESRILFVSQESSADVVQEAFGLGALGYVIKTNAGSELLSAVKAVSSGKQFFGRGIKSNDSDSVTGVQVTSGLLRGQAAASPASRQMNSDRGHAIEFYSDDESFLAGFSRFIATAVSGGNAVIAVATEPHLNSLFQRLQALDLNIGAAIEQGRFVPLDVDDTLSSFIVNDVPDPARFRRVVGDLITAAARAIPGEPSQVAICGECASSLWAQGKVDAAIQVEQLCNQLTKQYEMNILCGFSLSGFYREEDMQIFQRICSDS